MLNIQPEVFASLFEDVFTAITKQMNEVLDKQAGISVVYMVGGFFASPLLRERVEDSVRQLHCDIKVVFPPHPSLAIVSNVGRVETIFLT